MFAPDEVIINDFRSMGERCRVEEVEAGCDSGDFGACADLGITLWSMPNTNQAETYAYLLEGCNRGGRNDACLLVGEAFERGRGVPQDIARARSLYVRLCEEGYADGCAAESRFVAAEEAAAAAERERIAAEERRQREAAARAEAERVAAAEQAEAARLRAEAERVAAAEQAEAARLRAEAAELARLEAERAAAAEERARCVRRRSAGLIIGGTGVLLTAVGSYVASTWRITREEGEPWEDTIDSPGRRNVGLGMAIVGGALDVWGVAWGVRRCR